MYTEKPLQRRVRDSALAFREDPLERRVRNSTSVFRESVLVATTRCGTVAPFVPDADLSGQPIGLLLALTYA